MPERPAHVLWPVSLMIVCLGAMVALVFAGRREGYLHERLNNERIVGVQFRAQVLVLANDMLGLAQFRKDDAQLNSVLLKHSGTLGLATKKSAEEPAEPGAQGAEGASEGGE